MRDRPLPWSLERADVRVGAFVAGLLLLRLLTLPLGDFGYYMGVNEANYGIVARGYLEDPLTPRLGGAVYLLMPPLAPYLMAASFAVFGEHEWAARLPSLLVELGALAGVFFAARKLYDARVARYATIAFATMPWTVLWFGRAQTDPYLVALVTLALGALVHWRDRPWTLPAAGVFLGLAGASKQIAILFLIPALAFVWASRLEPATRNALLRRGGLWILIGGSPLALWLAYQAWQHPVEFVDAFLYQAGRGAPIAEQFPRSAGLGVFLGASPLWLAAAVKPLLEKDPGPRLLLHAWLLTYGLFVLVYTPGFHEYYTTILTPPLAILAGAGLARATLPLPVARRRQLLAASTALTLILSGAILGAAGDYGDETIRASAQGVARAAEASPGRVAVWLPEPFHPHFSYYVPAIVYDDVPSSRVVGLRYFTVPEPEALEASPGFDRVLVVLRDGAHLQEPFANLPRVGGADYEFLWEAQSMWVVQWR